MCLYVKHCVHCAYVCVRAVRFCAYKCKRAHACPCARSAAPPCAAPGQPSPCAARTRTPCALGQSGPCCHSRPSIVAPSPGPRAHAPAALPARQRPRRPHAPARSFTHRVRGQPATCPQPRRLDQPCPAHVATSPSRPDRPPCAHGLTRTRPRAPAARPRAISGPRTRAADRQQPSYPPLRPSAAPPQPRRSVPRHLDRAPLLPAPTRVNAHSAPASRPALRPPPRNGSNASRRTPREGWTWQEEIEGGENPVSSAPQPGSRLALSPVQVRGSRATGPHIASCGPGPHIDFPRQWWPSVTYHTAMSYVRPLDLLVAILP